MKSEVLRYEDVGGPRTIPRKAAIRCTHLVLCGNAYIVPSRLIGAADFWAWAPMHRDGSRSAITARKTAATNAAVADINWILDYFRRSQDIDCIRRDESATARPAAASGRSMRKRMARRPSPRSNRSRSLCLGRLPGHHMSRRAGLRRLARNVSAARLSVTESHSGLRN